MRTRKGTLYAKTDFGVIQRVGAEHRVDHGEAGPAHHDRPVSQIDQANRVMYVTTHGVGAWKLNLP